MYSHLKLSRFPNQSIRLLLIDTEKCVLDCKFNENHIAYSFLEQLAALFVCCVKHYSDLFVISSEKKASDVDDEEEWLKALEMGEVDERGYLPDKGNRKLTARQVV